MELFATVLFQGTLWHVVFKQQGLVHLCSFDGKQFKRNIDVTAVQEIDPFADGYPEE
jgi:hypothetical protein